MPIIALSSSSHLGMIQEPKKNQVRSKEAKMLLSMTNQQVS